MSAVSSAVTPAMTGLARATSVWSNRFGIFCIVTAILMLVAAPFLVDAVALPGYVVVLYVINAVAFFFAGYLLGRFSVKMKQAANEQTAGALIQALRFEHSYWQISVAVSVLTLVTTVGAVALPALRGAFGKSAHVRTAQDLEVIGAALEKYAAANHQYPKAANVVELATQLQPRFIDKLPSIDGWNHAFEYTATCENERCFAYKLSSAGPDGGYNYVFENGRFVTKSAEAGR